MTNSERTRRIRGTGLVLPLLAGVAACQVVATAWVWRCNHEMYEAVTALSSAGYFAIPNPVTAPTLLTFRYALLGGFFYTLTLGAGLAVFFSFLCHLFFRMGRTRVPALAVFLFLAAGIAVYVALGGFTLFPLLMILATSGATILTSFFLARRASVRPRVLSGVLFFLPILVLAMAWGVHMSSKIFDHLRDDVLLSSATGIAVNDFYYRYTLYAAEPFKSLQQKQQKTLMMKGFPDDRTSELIRDRFVRNDYLPVTDFSNPDLVAALDGNQMTLSRHGEVLVKIEESPFLRMPEKILLDASKKADKLRNFRAVIYFGLLFGFPLLLYTLVFSLAKVMGSLVLNPVGASGVAAMLCLAGGLAFLFPVAQAEKTAKEEQPVSELLQSEELYLRLAGLRKINAKRMDLCKEPAYKALVESPHPVERRWAAKVLGGASCKESVEDLKKMLTDPHPNVRCLALRSLGRRMGKGALPLILDVMKTSDHWYVQWYAYQAAENLGWRQHP